MHPFLIFSLPCNRYNLQKSIYVPLALSFTLEPWRYKPFHIEFIEMNETDPGV